MDRLQESELRRMGRTALQKAANAGAGKQSPGIARRPMLVTEVNSDGTLDLNMGSTDSQKILPGIRMTSACYGVKVGDVVVVETIDHKSFATGIVAKTSKDPNDTGPYVKGSVYTGSVVKSISNPYVEVITAAQIRSKAGRNAEWNNGDFCILVNGDESANDWHVQTVLNVGNAKVDARVTTYTGGTSVSGAVRIDYLLYMR